jgi:hypothetical protein
MGATLREYLVEQTSGTATDAAEFIPPEFISFFAGTSRDIEKVTESLEELAYGPSDVTTKTTKDQFLLLTDREDVEALVHRFYTDNGLKKDDETSDEINMDFKGPDIEACVTLGPTGDGYFVLESRTVRKTDMTGYETLDTYLGPETNSEFKTAAKAVYDLARSTKDKEEIGIYHIVFTTLLDTIRKCSMNGQPAPAPNNLGIRIEGDAGVINMEAIEAFTQRAYPIAIQAHNAMINSSHQSSALFHEAYVEALEKVIGTYLLGIKGDIKRYTEANQEVHRRNKFMSN